MTTATSVTKPTAKEYQQKLQVIMDTITASIDRVGEAEYRKQYKSLKMKAAKDGYRVREYGGGISVNLKY